MTYNNEQELRDRLVFLSNRDAWDLTNLLETAHRRVKSKFGRNIQETVTQHVKNQRLFVLSFPDIFQVNKVYYNNEEIDSSNYTVDAEDGTIEFSEDFANDYLNYHKKYKLTVYYVPKVYKDLELYYAMQEIVSLNMVETNDSEETNRLQQLNTTIKSITNDLLRSMPNVTRK